MRAAALVVVVLVAACATLAPAAAPTTFPAVPIASIRGDAAELRQIAAGRPLVVDFYATWCEPCREGFPRLARLARAHPEIAVVGVDIGEEVKLAAAFAARQGLDYPIFVDAELKLADACGVSRLPAVLAVDPDGRIVYRGDDVGAAAAALGISTR
jgi:thiol-disulfide isomerase/thioredoxin